MDRQYTVSQDKKSGMWYAHQKGYSYIPVAGSISERKSTATEYARMYDGLPNRVEEIETGRQAEYKMWLEG